MKKRNLFISVSVLIAFLVFGTVLVTAKKVNNPDPMSIINEKLDDILEILGISSTANHLRIHELSYSTTPPSSSRGYIYVSSTKPFQVKAVYFHLDDPGNDANLIFEDVGVYEYDPIFVDVWRIDHVDYDPAAGAESEISIELLSYMGVRTYPTVPSSEYLNSVGHNYDFVIEYEASSVTGQGEKIHLIIFVESLAQSTADFRIGIHD